MVVPSALAVVESPAVRRALRLPAAVGGFVGRTGEVESLRLAMAANRLVSIVGPGGSGKTRLALCTVEAHLAGIPDECVWVDLTSAHSDVPLDDFAACAVGMPLAATADAFARLCERFDEVPTVAVFDNCDHVLAPLTDLVITLLARCPTLRVVTTSREPLGLAGEYTHRVPPLDVPPIAGVATAEDLARWSATNLFMERALAAEPGLVVNAEAAGHIATICRRLDGIPLAIELAAAAVRGWALADIAAELDRAARTSLPQNPPASDPALGGPSTLAAPVPNRYGTLTASIAWSYDRLADADQMLLRRLSVFGGAFDLTAAVAVGADASGGERAVRDGVARLAAKSLLQFEPATGQYRMLGTIRDFAVERTSDALESYLTGARHAAHFAGVAQRFGEAGLSKPESALAGDLHEVLAALEWAMDALDPSEAYRIINGLGARWHLLGRFDAMHRAASWLLTRTPSDGEARWAAAMARLSYQALGTGRDEFARFTVEALAVAAINGDVASQLYLRYWPTVDRAFAGELEPLLTLLAEAEAAGVDDLVMSVARNLVCVHAICGRLRDAEAMAQRAFAVAERAGRGVEATESAHAFLAAALAFGGDVEGALRALSSGDFLGIVGRPNAALVHAALAFWLGRPELTDRARELLVGESHPINEAVVARAHWFLLVVNGEFDEAVQRARRVEPSPLPIVRCLFTLLDAELAAQRGDVRTCAQLLDEATPLTPHDAPQLHAIAALVSSRLAAIEGHAAVARKRATDAHRIASAAGLAWLVTQTDSLL